MNDKNGKEENKNEDRPVVVRNTTDLQRLKLEKLMKNPVRKCVNLICHLLKLVIHSVG